MQRWRSLCDGVSIHVPLGRGGRRGWAEGTFRHRQVSIHVPLGRGGRHELVQRDRVPAEVSIHVPLGRGGRHGEPVILRHLVSVSIHVPIGRGGRPVGVSGSVSASQFQSTSPSGEEDDPHGWTRGRWRCCFNPRPPRASRTTPPGGHRRAGAHVSIHVPLGRGGRRVRR
ncbi:Helicase PriA essential for oriC/DnaA-independent DNA replication [Chondromyces apiculatus DSM 436]|uniref:Helicase PriA essential for oriC/DnaA-independent DNA replication n=1 Tax=Chondromyces apiculatus DSM 436 TaxID=1192034 RepID=A0A017T9P3_9BACT|nr:Helicase PriA essential for oriC/DnaA-independent DNA replication [Chondromyces apiculatus DSM 436]